MAVRIIYFLFLAALTVCATISDAQAKQDIWTKELEESYRVCRGRLPDPIVGEDLEWVGNQTRQYVKYTDQVSFMRTLRVFVGGPKSQQPVSKIRCLFESPCITTEFMGGKSTATACNGAQIHSEYQPKANGVFDTTLTYPDGTPAYTLITVPALTDRKSFAVYISCFEDGSLAFTVAAIRPALSAHTRHVIREFLDHSGFQDHFRIVTNFMSSTCKFRL